MSDQDNNGRRTMLRPEAMKSHVHSVDIDSLLCSSSRSGMFRQSWSVYRQLRASLCPKTLSCMTTGSQAVEQAVSTSKNRLEQLKALADVDEEVKQFVNGETFKDRLFRTFVVDPYIGYTEQRKDVGLITKYTMYAFIVCGVAVGITEGRQKFKDQNKLTMFGSKYAVYKRKTNLMVKHGIECGMKIWFKCSASFLTCYGIYNFIEVYTNKSSFWSMSIAFGVTGALHRVFVGPKAMGAAFIIGLVFGSITGGAILLAKKADGKTQEEMNFKAARTYYTERRPYVMTYKQNVSTTDDVEEAD